MASAFVKFNQFAADMGLKIHNLGSDGLYISLQNVAPTATETVFSNLTEIAAGNGYVAGGTVVASTAWSQTAGLATLTGSNVVFTATGTVGPAEYATIYNNTATNKNLIGNWSYGSAVTLSASETLTINLSGGILTLQ